MYKRLFFLFFLIAFVLQHDLTFAQAVKNNPWISVRNKSNTDLMIDISTMRNSGDGDIYVWGLDTYKNLLKIEDIDSLIYRVKTFYLISPEQMRYSILEVVYYDSLNREITKFNYRKKTLDPVIKYNYPILNGSSLEAVLNKCREYINAKK